MWITALHLEASPGAPLSACGGRPPRSLIPVFHSTALPRGPTLQVPLVPAERS